MHTSMTHCNDAWVPRPQPTNPGACTQSSAYQAQGCTWHQRALCRYQGHKFPRHWLLLLLLAFTGLAAAGNPKADCLRAKATDNLPTAPRLQPPTYERPPMAANQQRADNANQPTAARTAYHLN